MKKKQVTGIVKGGGVVGEMGEMPDTFNDEDMQRFQELKARNKTLSDELKKVTEKAKAVDDIQTALSDLGFETTSMTHRDQAALIIEMTLKGVDSLLAEKLARVDTVLQVTSTMMQDKLKQVDALVQDLCETRQAINRVAGIAFDAEQQIHDIAFDAVDARVKLHQNTYHETKFNIDDYDFDSKRKRLLYGDEET